MSAGNCPNVPLFSLRKLLLSLMLPSNHFSFPNNQAAITSSNDLKLSQKSERDISFNQVAFDCSPEDTSETREHEVLGKVRRNYRAKNTILHLNTLSYDI